MDESVINVLEHFDQNGEGETLDRIEASLKALVVLDPRELNFRATGRRVTVADLPKGRAARTVSLSMTGLVEVG